MMRKIGAVWDRASAALERRDLSICAGLVFFLGVAAVAATDLVFYATNSAYFDRSVPTISRAGSFAPASYLFAVGMVLVAACIFVTWTMARRAHREWIARSIADPALAARANLLNESAAYAGCIAGFCLGTMGIVSLEISNITHMALSWGFFLSQIVAFILDTRLSLMLRRESLAGGGPVYDPNGRPSVCLIVCVVGLLFLFMFYAKDENVFADRLVAQWIFVASEHVVAFFSFYYSLRFLPLARAHVRARLALRRPPVADAAAEMATIPIRTSR